MPTQTSVELGRTIRAELARRGHSQTWLAKQLGINQSNISRRILGKQPFDVEQLEAIAVALDVRMEDLFPKSASKPVVAA